MLKLFLTLAILGSSMALKADVCILGTLTLHEAEAIALENNRDIQTLSQLVGKAREGKLEAYSKWFPQIVLMSMGYKSEKRDVFTKTHSVFISQFTLTQSLISADKFFNLRISKLAVQQLTQLYEAMVLDVLFEVRTLYTKLILDELNKKTAEMNTDILTSLVKKQESNYEIGTTILLNVNQSKVAVLNSLSAYYDASRNLKVDQDRFAVALGYNPGTVSFALASNTIDLKETQELKGKLEKVQALQNPSSETQIPLFTPEFPESEKKVMDNLFSCSEISFWESTALYYNPTLRAQGTEVKIKTQEVGKKWGEFLPEMNLEVNYGGQPTGTFDRVAPNFLNQKLDWGVGYRVNWLLWDSFGRDHRIKEAQFERCSKYSEFLRGVQGVMADVREQIFDIERSLSSYATASGAVALAEQTLDLATSQLEIGYINVFDYEIVVDGLIQARYTRDKASFDLMKGVYGLRLASGIDLMGVNE